MWGGPPFWIADNCSVDVRNLAGACEWYKEKLDLREIHNRKKDDSGRPFADVCLSGSRGMTGICSSNSSRAQLQANSMSFSTPRSLKRHSNG